MAKTDIVNPSREVLLQGDVGYKRSLSEALFTRVAAQNNFINFFQTDYHSFFLNGTYGVATGLIGYDGAYVGFYNFEISGVSFWNAISGSSGTTEFDIIWINQAGVVQGSIFSTTPKINSSSSNATRGFRNLVTGNDYTMTGVTLPTLSKTSFLEGETLYMVLKTAMVAARNAAITLYIRPIN